MSEQRIREEKIRPMAGEFIATLALERTALVDAHELLRRALAYLPGAASLGFRRGALQGATRSRCSTARNSSDGMSRGPKRFSHMLIFMVSQALSTWPLTVPTFAATQDPYEIRALSETKPIGLVIRIEDRATYLGTRAPLEIATALQAAAQQVLVRAIAVQSSAHEGIQIETPAVRLLALGDSYFFSSANRELVYLLDIVIDNAPDGSHDRIVSYYSTYGFYVTNAGLLSLQTADPVHTPHKLGAFLAPRPAELAPTLAKELNIAGFLQLVVDRMFTEAAK